MIPTREPSIGSEGSTVKQTAPSLAGRIGMVGGVVWVAGIILEYSKDLQPPADGALSTSIN